MAALGIWLWSDPRSFGTRNTCVIDFASTTILGLNVPLRSNALRMVSIVIYSLFLAPELNLILPMGLFLGIFLGYQTWNDRRRSKNGQSLPTLPSPIPHSRVKTVGRLRSAIRTWYIRIPSSPSIVPTVAGLVLLFAVNLVFLVDIEPTLRRNRGRQASGESFWTFGQILAMILLVLPLRDLVETMLARREKQRKDELARLEKQRKDQLTTHLQNAIREQAKTETLRELITNGADFNVKVEGAAITMVMKVN
jgi:hypothetical protein